MRVSFDALQWAGQIAFNKYVLGKPRAEALSERPVYMPGTALNRLEHHALHSSEFSISRGIGAVLARERSQPRNDVQRDHMFTPGSRVYSDLLEKRSERSVRQQMMRTFTWTTVCFASIYFMLNYVMPSVDSLDSVCRSRCAHHGKGESAILLYLTAYRAAPRTDCAGCGLAVFFFFLLGGLTSFVVIDAAFKALLALVGTYRGLRSGIQGMRQPDISQKVQFFKPGGGLAEDGKSMQAVLGPRWPAAWEKIARELYENDEITQSVMQQLIGMTNASKGAALQLADLPRMAQEHLTFFYRTIKRIETKFAKKGMFQNGMSDTGGEYALPSVTTLIPVYAETTSWLVRGVQSDAENPWYLQTLDGQATNLEFFASLYPDQWEKFTQRQVDRLISLDRLSLPLHEKQLLERFLQATCLRRYPVRDISSLCCSFPA